MSIKSWVALIGLALCASQACAAGNVVTIERGGHLLLNAKRFFPLGLYSKPAGEDPYGQMARAGFNLALTGWDQDAFDAAARAGVYCWIPFGSDVDLSSDAQAREAKIRATVAAAKDHPALLMWESQDEPAWTWGNPAKPAALPENLALGYRLIKALDPNHPVTLNHAPQNTIATLRKYNIACDTVSVDIYPIIPPDIVPMYGLTPNRRHGDLANQTPSCVGEYVDKMRAVAGPDRPVWMVLQAFAWARFDANAKIQSSVVYPTYEQTRFMAWQSVIHGCNGIIYFGANYSPQPGDCWNGIVKTVRELADLRDVLVADAATVKIEKDYDELGYSIDAGVETSVRDVGAARYILAANSALDPAALTLRGLGIADGEVEVVGEARTVAVKGGALHDKFDGLGVHIYKAHKAG